MLSLFFKKQHTLKHSGISKYIFWALLLLGCSGLYTLKAQTANTDRCYELRIYTSPKGRLNDLHRRFRDHTTALFEKHGMTNVGYWTPTDNPEEKLYYVLSYPNRAARDVSWKNFMADTTWQRVWKNSEVNGKIVSNIESIFLKTTDFSPNNIAAEPGRVWELRIYTAGTNRLPNLLERFSNHTVELFKQYGMTNKIYWTATDSAQGADKMLYYFLTHDSEKAAKQAFDRFRKDSVWLNVRKASEAKAGGSLTAVPVQSVYLYPTDYSPKPNQATGGNTASERALLEQTIQLYFDGWMTGDSTKVGKAMHSTCHLKYFRDGVFSDITRADYLSRFKPSAKQPGTTGRIVLLDITGNIATAKCELETPKALFTDYFTLIKTQDRWYITDKVSTRVNK